MSTQKFFANLDYSFQRLVTQESRLNSRRIYSIMEGKVLNYSNKNCVALRIGGVQTVKSHKQNTKLQLRGFLK